MWKPGFLKSSHIILNLVFSSHLKINNLDIVPGISDHDAIIFDLDIIHKATSSTNQHKVALYHMGDLQSTKNYLISFGDNFLHSDPQSRSINHLWWQEFKQAINKVILDHVPHKVNISHTCNRLPWINKQIKKDLKVRKRLYNKAKSK